MQQQRPLWPRWIAALVVFLVGAVAHAQVPASRDVVRGRVTTDSGVALVGARVVVTVSWTMRSQVATTDTAGRYTVAFAPGAGDYVVSVLSVGRLPFRRRVERVGRDSTFTVDAVLRPTTTRLASVQVRAARRQKPSVFAQAEPDVGGEER